MCFVLMIRRPPRSTQSRASAASDVYKRQLLSNDSGAGPRNGGSVTRKRLNVSDGISTICLCLSLIHISEPTRPY